MHRKRFLVISTAAGVTAALDLRRMAPVNAAESDAGPLRNFGDVDDRAETSQMLQALPPEALQGSFLAQTVLPPATRRVLTPLPPVATQGVTTDVGAPGSCTAQSWGYALATYTSAIGTSRDLTDPANQASAGWLYRYVLSLQNRVCLNGTPGKLYLERLVSAGAPSAADFPYDPDPAKYGTPPELCAYLDTANPSQEYAGESKFLIGSYKYITSITGKKLLYLPLFKRWIDAGHMIPFHGQNRTTSSYEVDPKLNAQGVYVPPALTVPPVATHCQAIVGYDDDLGALLVQNSFSPAWNSGGPLPGGNGRIWWSYDRFFEYQIGAAIAYPNVKAPGPGIPLTPSAAGGPTIAVHTAGIFDNPVLERGGLRFDITATEPAFVSAARVRGPQGGDYSSPVNERIRAGYVYVMKKGERPFRDGKYKLELAVTAGTQSLTYSGTVDVTG